MRRLGKPSLSASPSAFHEPPILLGVAMPLLRLVAPGNQEMSISIKIDRHNYRWLPVPKFLGRVSDAHPLNFANEPGNLNPLFLVSPWRRAYVLIYINLSYWFWHERVCTPIVNARKKDKKIENHRVGQLGLLVHHFSRLAN